MSGTIHAVIVTYNCESRILALLEQLMPQVQAAVVVDNGSDTITTSALSQAKTLYAEALTVIANSENLGIGVAQNQGIRQALAKGADWVLLMDDDSIPAPDMVSQLLAAQGQAQEPHKIIAPRIAEQQTAQPARYVTPWARILFRHHHLAANETIEHAWLAIASGSLIAREVFTTVGLMREDWFIDAIDHDFCLRARARGVALLLAGAAVLSHTQGRKREGKIMGMPLVSGHYNATRRYTITRNRLWLVRTHVGSAPWLVSYIFCALCIDLLRIVCLEDRKIEKVKSMLRGLAHGLLKPLGTAPCWQ